VHRPHADLGWVNPVLIAPLVIALGITLYMAKKQRAQQGSASAKPSKPGKVKAAKPGKVKPAKVKPAKAETPKIKTGRFKMPKLKASKDDSGTESLPAMADAVAAPAASPASRNGRRQPRRGSVL